MGRSHPPPPRDYLDVESWRRQGHYVLYERMGVTVTIHKDDILRIERTATSASGSGETWSPEPPPRLPAPPARVASKATLASYWENQKQYALQRTDDYANAGETCASRYRTKSIVKACQEESRQSYRFWNERYMSASREYERHR